MAPKSNEDYLRFEAAPDELSNKYLTAGEWYLRHQIVIYKIGVSLLAAFCIATLGYSFFVWGEYLIYGYTQDKQAAERAVLTNPNYLERRSTFGWRDLSVSSVNVYQASAQKYDFVAMVKNPNERWTAHAKFKYSYGGGETKVAETVVLPGAEQPIIFFGAEAENLPTDVQLIFTQVKWSLPSAHEVPDVPAYIADKNNFLVDKFNYLPGGEGGKLPILSFNLVNRSAFSYWRPVFYAALVSNDQVVGYQYLAFDSIKFGEVKPVNLAVTQTTARITGLRLYPAIDIFDNSVYIAPEK
jgi:hypothetical protein